MLNFIKFDLRKMFRMKGFWLSVLFFIALLGLNLTLDHNQYNMDYDQYYQTQTRNNEKAAENEGSGFQIEIVDEETYNQQQKALKEGMRFDPFILNSFTLTSVVCYIFFGLFVSNDFSSGYLKNILSIGGAKWKWITSKIVVASVLTLCLFILQILGGLVSEIISEQFLSTISFTGILGQLALNILLSILIMLLNITSILLSQSKVTTMIISSLFAMGVHLQLLTQIGKLLNIDIVGQFLSSRLQVMGYDFEGQFLPALLTGLTAFTLLYLFNRWYVYRIDFKFDH
ncbi:hypothetical protein HZY91_01630 [Facklamia sp. DSM 111018]|uniref:ABC transporter permease n=1 Tax=Facklamia lactis TaxID=2749967 RepID=A0ABS0LQ17_9LACT|nr:hypothetical protein [Facklamia lactis]MBG9979730.1 hypothetical protein [Facklamia lactis]MBG9985590.1 hypothetical protein [Facklamia lactis]